MPSVSNGQIYLMTLAGKMDGQICLNTFTYVAQDSTDPTKTTKQVSDQLNANLSVPDGGGNRFDTHYLNLLPAQYDWYETWIQVISPTRYVKEVYTGGGAGTSGVDGHWANSAACITRRAEQAGRKYISTLHICIPSELAAVSGEVPGAYLTDMGDFATEMRRTQAMAALSVNLVPCIYHKTGTPNFSKMVSTITQRTIRVMRRRTVNVGM